MFGKKIQDHLGKMLKVSERENLITRKILSFCHFVFSFTRITFKMAVCFNDCMTVINYVGKTFDQIKFVMPY